jgi:hypothetical protein
MREKTTVSNELEEDENPQKTHKQRPTIKDTQLKTHNQRPPK